MKVKFVNKTSPSVVYPRLMQPQMLQLSILEYWAKGYIYGLGQTRSISTNRRHKGRGTTLRNQQHENFVINYPFSLSGSGLKRMVGTTNIHLVRVLDTRITIEDCWSDLFLKIKMRLRQRNYWSHPFLSSTNILDVKERSFTRRLARDFL